MTYKSVKQGLPRSFTRVWVMTDTGRETTGYVKSDGEWFINCRASGRLVRRCCAGRRADVVYCFMVVQQAVHDMA